MATTTFSDVSGTPIVAAWLNDVNDFVYDDVINVKNSAYGATGNGSTDDATAIQAAITAGANKYVFFPPGTYKIGTAITVSNSVTIIGYNATINTGTSNISVFNITTSNVSVQGFTLVGPGFTAFNSGSRLVKATGIDNGAAVAPTYITNIKVTDNVFRSTNCSPVFFQFVQRGWIERNDMRDIVFAGVELQSCLDIMMKSNFIKNITVGTSGLTYGMYASRQNVADLVRHPLCEKITVDGNIFEDISWEGIDAHGIDTFIVTNNQLRNCGDSNAAIAIIHADNETSTPIAGCNNVVVSGNVITNAQQYGIATSSGFLHTNISITGNVLNNIGSSSTTNLWGGIRIGEAKGVSVIGNTLNYCAPYGVIVDKPNAADISITGNSFYRIVSNAVSTASAIVIDRTASGTGAITVGNNTLSLAATGETYEAVYGLRIAVGDGGNVTVLPNNFKAATTSQYSLTIAQVNSGSSFPINNWGLQAIAVTTAVATASTTITLPNPHSASTVYTTWGTISSAPSNERTFVHTTRVSPTQISITVYSTSGANFAANGNVNVFWQTGGY